jgi:excinuclease ABC subunit C
MRPPYNKLLKNYKNYKYIRIPVHKKYPIPEMVTETREDGALYFGPFTSQSSVENAVVFLKNHYGIRKCNSKTVKKSTSGCLNLHLGTCSGPCTGTDVSAPYMLEVNKIVQLLQGKDQEALRNLKSKMLMAAERLEFEKAAAYREQLKGIRHVLYKQKVIKISGYGRNVIAAEKYGESTAKLFFIKGNRLLKKEELTLSDWDCNALENKLKILARDSFKIPKGSTEKTLSQEEIDEAHIIYSYLKKSNNGIISANIPISRIETLNYSRIAGLIINSRAQDISKGDFENNTGEK